jgi:hypothetical protein
MLTIWTKNLKTPQEQDNFNNQVLGARPVLERLRDLLDEKTSELEATELTLKAYDNPNWAYQQAHKNGYKGAMKYLKDLINLDQQKANYEPTRR